MRRARFAFGEAGAFVWCEAGAAHAVALVTRASRGWSWLALPLVLALAACGSGAPPPLEPAARVIESSADSLMTIPGVVGVYEGLSGRETVIRIMLATRTDSLVRHLPKRLGGYRVELEFGGPIEPMRR